MDTSSVVETAINLVASLITIGSALSAQWVIVKRPERLSSMSTVHPFPQALLATILCVFCQFLFMSPTSYVLHMIFKIEETFSILFTGSLVLVGYAWLCSFVFYRFHPKSSKDEESLLFILPAILTVVFFFFILIGALDSAKSSIGLEQTILLFLTLSMYIYFLLYWGQYVVSFDFTEGKEAQSNKGGASADTEK